MTFCHRPLCLKNANTTQELTFIVIPTYSQISSKYIYVKITATCFGVNTPSTASLQICQLKLRIIKMIKYNIVMCGYDKILVNVATYVIPG